LREYSLGRRSRRDVRHVAIVMVARAAKVATRVAVDV